MKIIAIMAIAAILAGCEEPAPEKSPRSELRIADGYMTKWHDDDSAVTCWIWDGHSAGGISCIPDSQLENRKQ